MALRFFLIDWPDHHLDVGRALRQSTSALYYLQENADLTRTRLDASATLVGASFVALTDLGVLGV